MAIMKVESNRTNSLSIEQHFLADTIMHFPRYSSPERDESNYDKKCMKENRHHTARCFQGDNKQHFGCPPPSTNRKQKQNRPPRTPKLVQKDAKYAEMCGDILRRRMEKRDDPSEELKCIWNHEMATSSKEINSVESKEKCTFDRKKKRKHMQNYENCHASYNKVNRVSRVNSKNCPPKSKRRYRHHPPYCCLHRRICSNKHSTQLRQTVSAPSVLKSSNNEHAAILVLNENSRKILRELQTAFNHIETSCEKHERENTNPKKGDKHNSSVRGDEKRERAKFNVKTAFREPKMFNEEFKPGKDPRSPRCLAVSPSTLPTFQKIRQHLNEILNKMDLEASAGSRIKQLIDEAEERFSPPKNQSTIVKSKREREYDELINEIKVGLNKCNNERNMTVPSEFHKKPSIMKQYDDFPKELKKSVESMKFSDHNLINKTPSVRSMSSMGTSIMGTEKSTLKKFFRFRRKGRSLKTASQFSQSNHGKASSLAAASDVSQISEAYSKISKLEDEMKEMQQSFREHCKKKDCKIKAKQTFLKLFQNI